MKEKMAAALLTVVITAWIAVAPGMHSHAAPLFSFSGPDVSIDLDLGNGGGACAVTDSTRTVMSGETFSVAICVRGLVESPAAFAYKLIYDDQVIHVPDVEDSGLALDDNPDANAGATTFGTSSLGVGWDCSGAGLAYPAGDVDPSTGPGHGEAFSGGCISTAGPYELTGTGVLAIVTFAADTPGSTDLAFRHLSIYGESGAEVATCEPAFSAAASCPRGALLVMSTSGTAATSSPAATSAPSGVPSADATGGPGSGGHPVPTVTATSPTPGGGGRGRVIGTPVNSRSSGPTAATSPGPMTNGPTLALDADVTNGDGPCSPVDGEAKLKRGESRQVAVCLIDPEEPPAAFDLAVLYDQQVVEAPNVGRCDGDIRQSEVADPGDALDCNPDVNAGTVTFGTPLGDDFDCSGGGETEPWGNGPDPQGDAFIGICMSVAGPYELPSPGVLAMITFVGRGGGESSLTLTRAVIVGASGEDGGSCHPAKRPGLRCLDAKLSVSTPGAKHTALTWAGVTTGLIALTVLALAVIRSRRKLPA